MGFYLIECSIKQTNKQKETYLSRKTRKHFLKEKQSGKEADGNLLVYNKDRKTLKSTSLCVLLFLIFQKCITYFKNHFNQYFTMYIPFIK